MQLFLFDEQMDIVLCIFCAKSSVGLSLVFCLLCK